MSLIAFFAYLWKVIFKYVEGGYSSPSVQEELKWKILQLRFYEIVAWTFIPLGIVVYVFGFVSSSDFLVFLIASGLMVVGFLFARYCRTRRLTHQESLEEL